MTTPADSEAWSDDTAEKKQAGNHRAGPDDEAFGDASDLQKHSSDTQSNRVEPDDHPAGEEDEFADELPEWEPLTPELVEDEAIRGDFMLRFCAVLLALLLACTKIGETTTLVHIKSGQYLAANGWLTPTHDVFSYTADAHRWVNLGWLFDLTVAGIFSIGGAVGLTVFKAVLVAVTFCLIVYVSRRGVSSWWGSICAALATVVCHPQFTARPELVTIFGVSLTLWSLHRWREGGASKNLWMLAALFFVWSNLDPRVFLGLALLLLYAAGEAVGHLLGRPSLADDSARKTLWSVVAACVLASLLNPFGWNSLIAPFWLYGTEYPALRMYYQNAVSVNELQFYPMTASIFWQSLSHQTIAGLLLLATAAVTFVLNRAKLDWGELFMFLGFLGFAVAGSHELASASVVACVISTLNAQAWYRTSFRQSYSVETSELLFSRGGRAVTVLAFFALAYLAISGNLGGANARHTGFGLEQSLRADIDGLREELRDSFDNRPFNFTLRQGDVLIWINQKVFVDSRVTLYSGTGDENLLDIHNRTRHALRSRKKGQQLTGKKSVWRRHFDQFKVTHVLPRLGGSNPDYITYLDLLRDPDWQLTYLGAVSAGFYRRDTDNPRLEEYLASHRVDFAKTAFQVQAARLVDRTDWPQRPSVYQQYLSFPDRRKPNAIQQAQHYQIHLQVGTDGTRRISPQRGAAVAHLAIRKANEGLAENPQSAIGYRVLGAVYDFLAGLELEVARSFGGSSVPGRRFHQAVFSYQQSLMIEPRSPITQLRLTEAYAAQNKLDLALEAAEAYEELTAEQTNFSEAELRQQQQNARFIQNLNIPVERVESQVKDALDKGTNRLAVAVFAYQQGCVLKALEVLEHNPDSVSQGLEAQLLKARMLMEAGRAEEAFGVIGRLEGVAEQFGGLNWRPLAALCSLANARYDRAVRFWTKEANSLDDQRLAGLLHSLPLVTPPAIMFRRASDSWPLQQTGAAITALYQLPSQAAERMFHVALCHLETGDCKAAAVCFRRALKIHPETSFRPLVRFYLSLLTGEFIDLVPPSDWIPITPDIFSPEQKPQPQPTK